MLARSYHDLHECNSSQLVVITIAFIRNHLEPNILWELCHFSTGASRPLLWLLRKANTGEIFRMLVTFRLTPVKQSSLKCVSSNLWTVLKLHNHSCQVQVHSCTFAGRSFWLLYAFPFFSSIFAFVGRPFLHFCLCRTSIFVFFTFFPFLPLQDEHFCIFYFFPFLPLRDEHFCIFYFFSILAFAGRAFLHFLLFSILAFAGRAFLHFLLFFHSCLCRTSIFSFFTFFHSCLCRTSIFAFLPLQDEQGENSSCTHWQFDKTHFSSTIKWSFIAWMVKMKMSVIMIDGLLWLIEPGLTAEASFSSCVTATILLPLPRSLVHLDIWSFGP